MDRLRQLGRAVQAWVADHRIVAPLLFLLAYVSCALLALPVWWLQVLAGFGFGLVMGIGWSLAGAVAGTVLAMSASRWLGAERMTRRAAGRLRTLRRLDRRLGRNGLLVVMAVRLCYVLPFGLSNYLFGITRMTVRDAALGSLLGGFPAIAVYVAIGVDPRLLTSPRFIVTVAGVNVLLLLPLALRYRRRGTTTPRE